MSGKMDDGRWKTENRKCEDEDEDFISSTSPNGLLVVVGSGARRLGLHSVPVTREPGIAS